MSRRAGRIADDFVGLALLLVTALRRPIPLPIDEPARHKACSRCGEWLPLEECNRKSRAHDGHRAGFRECQHKTARALYHAKVHSPWRRCISSPDDEMQRAGVRPRREA